ncbi:MAG: TIGR04282 family arsenosugar biosynthesis glycosyltransferase [Planctomycetota bacterium]|jgi:rSAM/selenodomain-associated transferase 1
MSPSSDNCILLFVKHPAPGRVKTRLAEQLGPGRAAALYENFVLDLLDTLRSLNVNLRIFFEPAEALNDIRHWLGENHSYVLQRGNNLGQRMKNAFAYAFADGCSKGVLIGSDLPDLPADFLSLGLRALDTGDAVLGPSSDGGYYLIGFSRETFLPEAFDNIAWGTDRVFAHTVKTLKRHRRKLYVLPRWHDVDTLEDLKSLVARSRGTDFRNSRTFTFLQEQVTEVV